MRHREYAVAAIGCGRLKGALQIADRQPFVVFATIDQVLPPVHETAIPVYFYETG